MAATDGNFVKLFSSLKYLKKKKVREQQHLNFLKDCIYFDVIPKFIKCNNLFLSKTFNKDLKYFENKILKKYIHKKYGIIDQLNNEIKIVNAQLKSNCNNETYKASMLKINYFCKIENELIQKKHNKKLKFWLTKQKEEVIKKAEHTSQFINVSSHTLNNHQKAVLNLGPKFILDNKININDTITCIETAIKNAPIRNKSEIRLFAQRELLKKQKEPVKDKEDKKCLKELKENDQLACLMSDKTGKIVIMDKVDYLTKMNETIAQIGVNEIKKDPTKNLQNKVKQILKEGIWPDEINPPYNGQNTNAPRLFGKFKDHKSPPSLRPIVSKCEGPTYFLERYIKPILLHLIPPSDSSLTSTDEFINRLNTLSLEDGDIMVSFDVVNLFPSIDISEMISIINNSIIGNFSNEIANTLKNTINLILNNSYFQFNSKFYKQTQGVPMGSPISGILADWKLRILENSILNNLKAEIKVWWRYVDDIFAVVKHQDVVKLLEIINSYDNNIKFTLEKEIDNTLNFLDVKIMRTKQNEIITTVYRKPTNNNTIVSFNSNIPYKYKISTINSYVNRAIKICSNEQLLNEEILFINTLCKNANYPPHIVNKVYKNRLKKLNNIDNAQKEQIKFTNAIPHCRGAGNRIANFASKRKLNISIKPDLSIFKRIRTDKDPINPLETAGIYKINFYDNDKKSNKCYIGVTKRRINERIKEHISDLKYGRLATALSRYNAENNITVDFKDIEKLSNYKNHAYGFQREALEIIAHKTETVNDMTHATVDDGWLEFMYKRATQKDEDKKPEDDPEKD